MKLSFHGQSTIYFESNDKKVIVDPFISGNDKSDLDEQTLDRCGLYYFNAWTW